MGLNMSKEYTEKYCGRKYNVEYEMGNGRIQTLSNILENADGTYFWFVSEEDGMDVIRQDCIRTMICINKKKL